MVAVFFVWSVGNILSESKNIPKGSPNWSTVFIVIQDFKLSHPPVGTNAIFASLKVLSISPLSFKTLHKCSKKIISVLPSIRINPLVSLEIGSGNTPKVSVIFCKTSSLPLLTCDLSDFSTNRRLVVGNNPPRAGVWVVKIIWVFSLDDNSRKASMSNFWCDGCWDVSGSSKA